MGGAWLSDVAPRGTRRMWLTPFASWLMTVPPCASTLSFKLTMYIACMSCSCCSLARMRCSTSAPQASRCGIPLSDMSGVSNASYCASPPAPENAGLDGGASVPSDSPMISTPGLECLLGAVPAWVTVYPSCCSSFVAPPPPPSLIPLLPHAPAPEGSSMAAPAGCPCCAYLSAKDVMWAGGSGPMSNTYTTLPRKRLISGRLCPRPESSPSASSMIWSSVLGPCFSPPSCSMPPLPTSSKTSRSLASLCEAASCSFSACWYCSESIRRSMRLARSLPSVSSCTYQGRP
mmetsp:Transcript_7434/g.17962  ORF Transcript_7434/g.17962 Transcript_7434/m.17962 type:complete len:289 (+) Transcript_7434:511-1377(+)